MDNNNLLTVVSIFALLLCLLPPSVNSVVSYPIARVSVKPSANEVRIGDNFTIDVNATDVDDLYSFEFKLSYDTSFLDGLSVTAPPPWPHPSGSEIVDSEGYVWINCSLTEPPGITGDVTLASIVFGATAGGNASLYLYVINFSNSTGGLIPLIVNDGSIIVWPWNVHIPEDYSTIQKGINAANSGDIIFVSSDTYYEHVIVNKTVSLIGESKETTIIDGNGTGTVVTVVASNVEIEGFTVQNGGDCGVLVWNCVNNMISHNILKDNYNGLELLESNSSNIFDNAIVNNSNVGLCLSQSNSNNITGNVMQNNIIGVLLSSSHMPNVLYHNNFIDNSIQVNDEGGNIWDNGCEGNYWSDYNGTDLDGDGVGDTYLPWHDVDNYPLMSYYILGDINHDGCVDYSDMFVLGDAYIHGTTPEDPGWNGHTDLNNDRRIDYWDVFLFGVAYIGST